MTETKPLTFVLHGSEWQWKDLADSAAEARESEWQTVQFANTADHDHCNICFWRLASDDEPSVGTGYRAGNRVLCQECHQLFVVAGERCFSCGDTLDTKGDRVQGCTLHPKRKYRWYHHECYDRACGAID